MVRSLVKVGDSAPDFTLSDAHGSLFRFYSLLRDSHVVIVFYRGNWCPYCDLQLRDFQRRLTDLRDLHAQVVAISPQPPANLLETQVNNHLEFPVLSDVGDKVARQFGLVVEVNDRLVALYRLFGHHIGDGSFAAGKKQLPVLGTFLVDGNATVRLAHVDADHARQIDVDQVIQTLIQLTNGLPDSSTQFLSAP